MTMGTDTVYLVVTEYITSSPLVSWHATADAALRTFETIAAMRYFGSRVTLYCCHNDAMGFKTSTIMKCKIAFEIEEKR